MALLNVRKEAEWGGGGQKVRVMMDGEWDLNSMPRIVHKLSCINGCREGSTRSDTRACPLVAACLGHQTLNPNSDQCLARPASETDVGILPASPFGPPRRDPKPAAARRHGIKMVATPRGHDGRPKQSSRTSRTLSMLCSLARRRMPCAHRTHSVPYGTAPHDALLGFQPRVHLVRTCKSSGWLRISGSGILSPSQKQGA